MQDEDRSWIECETIALDFYGFYILCLQVAIGNFQCLNKRGEFVRVLNGKERKEPCMFEMKIRRKDTFCLLFGVKKTNARHYCLLKDRDTPAFTKRNSAFDPFVLIIITPILYS